jgi:hypothetical protein
MISPRDIQDIENFCARVEMLTRGWCPHDPTSKQKEFLELGEREALYGGAAGGGKSDALLMGALQYVDQKDFAALVLRRSYTDLSLPGAIMDRSHDWLRNSGAHWDDRKKSWKFPSGASITFGYLENEKDKYRYQSSEFQYIAFDKLTQFVETQYLYLLSRLRRLRGSSTPLRMRAASNPGGVGHDWVKARFVDGNKAFVPARLDDNPHLDREEYRYALEQLDETTRAQLRDGIWVRDGYGLVYKFEPERNIVEQLPTGHEWQHILGVDLGASEIKATTAFCVISFSYTHETTYVSWSMAESGLIPSTVAEHILGIEDDIGGFTAIVMDEGALGKGYAEEIRQRWSIPVQPAQKTNKLGYRKLLNGELERAKLRVLEPANSELIQELQTLPWNDKGLDNEKGYDNHLTDAMLYAWREAKTHMSHEAKPTAPLGSREYYEQEAERMIEEEETDHYREQSHWWER